MSISITKTQYVLISVLLLLLFVLFGVVFWQNHISEVAKRNKEVQDSLMVDSIPGVYFQIEELGEYDGSDENKPIYIGLNGYVYDVTAGREFYEPGGIYHYLAGRDASTELNIIGGDIISQKYPVAGRLIG